MTVIVLNWNGKRFLEDCLTSVLAQDFDEDFDVLLWDNGSVDGSQEFVRERFPGVRLVEAGENLGFAKAMNRAIAMVETEFVALLNNDAVADQAWLRTGLGCLSNHSSDVIAAGSTVFDLEGGGVQHAGARFSRFGGAYDIPTAAPGGETAAACGGAMVVRRRGFLELGGFHDDFFLCFEDAEFGYRAWMRGYRILHEPRSRVRHVGGASMGGRSSPVRAYWGHRNRLRMVVEDYGRWNLAAGALLWGVLSAARPLAFIAAGNVAAAAAILRATAAGAWRIPDMVRRRTERQTHRVKTDAWMKRRGLWARRGDLRGALGAV